MLATQKTIPPPSSWPLHQWLSATSFCLVGFLNVSLVDCWWSLCCFVGLSASGTHTLPGQASFGHLRPLGLKLFLIAVFSMNVLLSWCNDPFFFFNHRADGIRWAARSHRGDVTQRGGSDSEVRTHGGLVASVFTKRFHFIDCFDYCSHREKKS